MLTEIELNHVYRDSKGQMWWTAYFVGKASVVVREFDGEAFPDPTVAKVISLNTLAKMTRVDD